jgi:hypothetical protein
MRGRYLGIFAYGPCYFSTHVLALTYVEENGDLHALSDLADGTTFYEFNCSFGLSEIIVECLVETRPATLCRSEISTKVFAAPADLSSALLTKRSQCDALLAISEIRRMRAVTEMATPIQTQWLKRGDVKIPKKLAKPRFTTPYYDQFLD